MLRDGWKMGALIACLTLVSGCSRITITSEPGGAQILYSPAGSPPWMSWPPKRSTAKMTPGRALSRPEPYYYVRVEKEGYHPAPPKFIDVGLLRHQYVHFDLKPRPETLGLVWYGGRWVDPKQARLVRYRDQWMSVGEKSEREQREKGLVFDAVDNRWMPPEERRKRVEARMREQNLAPWKGRWVKADELEEAKAIDQEVQRLADSDRTFPVSAERVGAVVDALTTAQLHLTNLFPRPLEVLLSGPQSRRVQLEGRGRATFVVPAGTYRLVVREMERPGAAVGVATLELAARTRYLAICRGGPDQVGR